MRGMQEGVGGARCDDWKRLHAAVVALDEVRCIVILLSLTPAVPWKSDGRGDLRDVDLSARSGTRDSRRSREGGLLNLAEFVLREHYLE